MVVSFYIDLKLRRNKRATFGS